MSPCTLALDRNTGNLFGLRVEEFVQSGEIQLLIDREGKAVSGISDSDEALFFDTGLVIFNAHRVWNEIVGVAVQKMTGRRERFIDSIGDAASGSKPPKRRAPSLAMG